MSEEKKKLGPHSTMQEIFDFIRPEKGVKVQAIRMSDRDDGISDICICLTGSEMEADVLAANLMSYVDEMYMLAEQVAKNEEQQNEQPANDIP